jgi:hypothetical protein
VNGTFDYALLKTIGLVVFFVAFAVIVLRLVLAGRHRYDRIRRIPLEGDPIDERQPPVSIERRR